MHRLVLPMSSPAVMLCQHPLIGHARIKQNRPLPQWFRLKTGTKIRYNKPVPKLLIWPQLGAATPGWWSLFSTPCSQRTISRQFSSASFVVVSKALVCQGIVCSDCQQVSPSLASRQDWHLSLLLSKPSSTLAEAMFVILKLASRLFVLAARSEEQRPRNGSI